MYVRLENIDLYRLKNKMYELSCLTEGNVLKSICFTKYNCDTLY